MMKNGFFFGIFIPFGFLDTFWRVGKLLEVFFNGGSGVGVYRFSLKVRK
jgi:hypothetical protein